MTDTTIKVDTAVRDRLATLAQERGITIRDLVAELSRATPTVEEKQRRYAEADVYARTHFADDASPNDDAAERFWITLANGGEVDSL